MMKRKMMVSLFIIALALAMIGGGTMAWFSYKAEGGEAVFAMGTVIIDADFKGEVEEVKFENVNPGDCFCVGWEIENRGSKAIALRVEIDGSWVLDAGYLTDNWDGLCFTEQEDYDDADDLKAVYEALALDAYNLDPDVARSPVAIIDCPENDYKWILVKETIDDVDKFFLYYVGDDGKLLSIPGTYAVEEEGADDADRFVDLCLCIAFDGPVMTNVYQAATFTLVAKAEAVQFSYGAPAEAWAGVTGNETDGYVVSDDELFGNYFAGFDFTKCEDLEGNPAACCQPEQD